MKGTIEDDALGSRNSTFNDALVLGLLAEDDLTQDELNILPLMLAGMLFGWRGAVRVHSFFSSCHSAAYLVPLAWERTAT